MCDLRTSRHNSNIERSSHSIVSIRISTNDREINDTINRNLRLLHLICIKREREKERERIIIPFNNNILFG